MRRFRLVTPFIIGMLVLSACGGGDDGSPGDGDGEGGYVFQGPDGALNTQFGNGGDCLFTDPPGCFLHHQASFMAGEAGFFETNFPDVAVAGETYDFFPHASHGVRCRYNVGGPVRHVQRHAAGSAR